jgi:hypothetical protein
MTVHVLVPRLHERRSRGPLAIPAAVPQGLPDEERGARAQSRRCRNGRCLACPRGPAAHDRLTSAHLDRLTAAQSDRTLDADCTLDIARITARLDYLQHRRPVLPHGVGVQR